MIEEKIDSTVYAVEYNDKGNWTSVEGKSNIAEAMKALDSWKAKRTDLQWRLAKYEKMKQTELRWEEWGPEGELDTLIVAYGTMARIAKTTIDLLRETGGGRKIGLFRPISLSFRLYGNIFAGENMLEAMATLVPGFGWLLPIPFYFMELLVGIVQALVFMLLTAVFTLLICQHEEEGKAAAHD